MKWRGRIAQQVPMAGHVSWKAGGDASQAIWPADLDELCAWLKSAAGGQPLLFVGAGSNLLVRDGGFAGTVVFSRPGLMALRVETQAPAKGYRRLYAGAGVSGAELAAYAAVQGLTGLEFLAGIPGTVGGALVGNAGCFSSEAWDSVASVQVVQRGGGLAVRSAAEYEIGYREAKLVEPSEEWFVGVWFDLRERDGSLARQTIDEFLARRAASQPLEEANAGRVFRNPAGQVAAALIEQAGLAGLGSGPALLSRRHANYIVTRGGATAAEIEGLIAEVRQAVKQQCGIELMVEATIVGSAK